MRNRGLHATVKYATINDIAIVVQWDPPSVNDPPKASVTWTGIKSDVNGAALPSVLSNGETAIIVRRPKIQQALAVNTNGYQDSVILTPLPPQLPPSKCGKAMGRFHFTNDNCGDNWSLQGRVIFIYFGNGNQTVVPKNNPDYDARLGTWLVGDFNGDGLDDLVHMVVGGPIPPNGGYVHVHFPIGENDFNPPTTGFVFSQFANPQHDYNASLGFWRVEDLDHDGRDDLVHDPKLPDGRIHKWYSNGDGTFTLK